MGGMAGREILESGPWRVTQDGPRKRLSMPLVGAPLDGARFLRWRISKTGVVKQRPYLIANIRDDLCNSFLSDPKGLGQFSPKPIY